jgi:hypothetical protein
VTGPITLANNLIGLAPGPLLVGLKLALTLAPVMALAGAACFVLSSRSDVADAAHNQTRVTQ